MDQQSKQVLLLSWFVGKKNAVDIICNEEEFDDEMIETQVKKLPASIVNEEVCVDLLSQFCSSSRILITLKELKDKKKRNPSWSCGTCKKGLKRCRSICCDRCFIWSHFNCTGMDKNPVGDWFCLACIAEVQTGRKYEIFIKLYPLTKQDRSKV